LIYFLVRFTKLYFYSIHTIFIIVAYLEKYVEVIYFGKVTMFTTRIMKLIIL